MAALPVAGAPLKDVAKWVQHYQRFWEESLDRLGDYLLELKAQEAEKKEKHHGRKRAKSQE